MKTLIPKRGWHIAQIGEYCPIGNTAMWWYGEGEWDYNPLYGGFMNEKDMFFSNPTIAVRNHPRE